MGHLVKQHEQHIAGHKFRAPLNIFWRKALESCIAFAKRLGSRIDPGLKVSRFRRIRRFRLGWGRRQRWTGLRKNGLGDTETEHEGHHHAPRPEQNAMTQHGWHLDPFFDSINTWRSG